MPQIVDENLKYMSYVIKIRQVHSVNAVNDHTLLLFEIRSGDLIVCYLIFSKIQQQVVFNFSLKKMFVFNVKMNREDNC